MYKYGFGSNTLNSYKSPVTLFRRFLPLAFPMYAPHLALHSALIEPVSNHMNDHFLPGRLIQQIDHASPIEMSYEMNGEEVRVAMMEIKGLHQFQAPYHLVFSVPDNQTILLPTSSSRCGASGAS